MGAGAYQRNRPHQGGGADRTSNDGRENTGRWGIQQDSGSRRITGDRMNIYIENGYANRKEYLDELAEMFCLPVGMVYASAEELGPNEDFDGLVSILEDEAMMHGDNLYTIFNV